MWQVLERGVHLWTAAVQTHEDLQGPPKEGCGHGHHRKQGRCSCKQQQGLHGHKQQQGWCNHPGWEEEAQVKGSAT